MTVNHHDAYYLHLTDLTTEERSKINFDHPDWLYTQLFVEHINQLISWKNVEKTFYDFAKYSRSTEPMKAVPCPTIIVDAILFLNDSKQREMIN